MPVEMEESVPSRSLRQMVAAGVSPGSVQVIVPHDKQAAGTASGGSIDSTVYTVSLPAHPFRLMATGTDVNGFGFQRKLSRAGLCVCISN